MREKDRWCTSFPESTQWNALKTSLARFRLLPPIRMTTELRTIVPKVELVHELARFAPALENTWVPTTLTRPLSFVPTLALSLGFQPVKIKTSSVEEPSWEGFVVSQSMWEALNKTEAPVLEADFSHKVARPKVSNTMEALLKVPLNVITSEAPSRRPVVAILREALSQRMTSLVEEVRARLDQLVSPMPAFAPGAVLTGGPVRTRGGLEKEALGRVTAFVLNENWEPERRLALPAIEGPIIKDGRLTLVLWVEDPSLAGCEADLALVVEGLEVALCSAKVPAPRKGGARLAFELDLGKAGIKVRDGFLPMKVLQVFIEPKGKKEANKGKKEQI